MVSMAPSDPITIPVVSLSFQLGSYTEARETIKITRDSEREVNLGWEQLDVQVKSSMEEGEGRSNTSYFNRDNVRIIK